MAKKPDTPCAGCGKLLWGGGTSLPAGQRRCKQCRLRTGNPLLHTFACAECGTAFQSRNLGSRYCSIPCKVEASRGQPRHVDPATFRPRPCMDCGTDVRGTGTTPLCPPCGAVRRAQRYAAASRRRRATKRGAMAEGYTLAEIARRDRYTCGLCHKRVAMKQQMPHPRSPVVDHIMPIARGGDDTKANVWLAHWYCNAVKGARLITHQAALF